MPETRRIALIAGGIGMPPLFGLAETVRGPQYTLFYGARSQNDLLELDQWSKLGIPVHTATDDGSAGYHGLITDVLSNGLSAGAFDYLVACGPKPMLAAVQGLAVSHGVPGELSLESYMACGVGACLGCVCSTNQGYKRVCVDGPVFKAGEVKF
jgi:dihydroorotate dehydrogenase electron transfer subunit